MFTLYIHCLEVLAMKAEGQTVKTIVEMGCEWSRQKVGAALYELEQEGYVTRDTSGKAHVWQITEKACEYCERIARLYSASHVMDEIAAYVENMPSEAQKEGVTEVSETPILLSSLHSGVCSICYHFETSLDGDNMCALCSDNYDQYHHLGQYGVEAECEPIVVIDPYATHLCDKCQAMLHTDEEIRHNLCMMCLWE